MHEPPIIIFPITGTVESWNLQRALSADADRLAREGHLDDMDGVLSLMSRLSVAALLAHEARTESVPLSYDFPLGRKEAALVMSALAARIEYLRHNQDGTQLGGVQAFNETEALHTRLRLVYTAAQGLNGHHTTEK